MPIRSEVRGAQGEERGCSVTSAARTRLSARRPLERPREPAAWGPPGGKLGPTNRLRQSHTSEPCDYVTTSTDEPCEPRAWSPGPGWLGSCWVCSCLCPLLLGAW